MARRLESVSPHARATCRTATAKCTATDSMSTTAMIAVVIAVDRAVRYENCKSGVAIGCTTQNVSSAAAPQPPPSHGRRRACLRHILTPISQRRVLSCCYLETLMRPRFLLAIAATLVAAPAYSQPGRRQATPIQQGEPCPSGQTEVRPRSFMAPDIAPPSI